MEFEAERLMYITNLLVETLPKSQKNNEVLKRMDISEEGRYVVLQIKLNRHFREHIHNMNEELVSGWKIDFQESLESWLQDSKMDLVCMLNLTPMHRTFVLKFKVDSKSAKSDLSDNESTKDEILKMKETYELINNQLFNKYGSNVIGCYGKVVSSFFKIGQSYKQARKINDYYYTIGIGNCAMSSDYEHEEEGSLVEYKYIHHFDSLMGKQDWTQIMELLNTTKQAMISNRVNNSKTMYIYKEIFSITIRHLFTDPDQHYDEIKKLNHGVLMFDQLFDDIHEIHDYYLQIFEIFSEDHLYKGLNPHIRKVVRLIKQRFKEPIGQEEIADELGITTAYLSRLFKQEMNITFKSYVIGYRIDKSKELLANTSMKIEEIRVEVGYQTATQFVRAFKSREGMTPSAYRNIMRKTQ